MWIPGHTVSRNRWCGSGTRPMFPGYRAPVLSNAVIGRLALFANRASVKLTPQSVNRLSACICSATFSGSHTSSESKNATHGVKTNRSPLLIAAHLPWFGCHWYRIRVPPVGCAAISAPTCSRVSSSEPSSTTTTSCTGQVCSRMLLTALETRLARLNVGTRAVTAYAPLIAAGTRGSWLRHPLDGTGLRGGLRNRIHGKSRAYAPG